MWVPEHVEWWDTNDDSRKVEPALAFKYLRLSLNLSRLNFMVSQWSTADDPHSAQCVHSLQWNICAHFYFVLLCTFHSKQVLGQYISKHFQSLLITFSIEARHWHAAISAVAGRLKHLGSARQKESELTVFLRPEWLICSLFFITGLILELSAVTKNSRCNININEAHLREHTSAFKRVSHWTHSRVHKAQVTRAQWEYLGQSCGINKSIKKRQYRQNHCVFTQWSVLRFWAFWLFKICCLRLMERKYPKYMFLFISLHCICLRL